MFICECYTVPDSTDGESDSPLSGEITMPADTLIKTLYALLSMVRVSWSPRLLAHYTRVAEVVVDFMDWKHSCLFQVDSGSDPHCNFRCVHPAVRKAFIKLIL